MLKEVVATMRTPEGKIFTNTSLTEHTDHLKFFWTEGNFGCDCNRSIFAIDACVMDEELDCNTGEPTIELISLKVDGREVLN